MINIANITRYLFFAIFCLLSINDAVAQTESGTPEPFVLNKPYIVNRVPTGTEWTVQKDLHPESVSAQAVPDQKPSAKITTVKTSNFILRRSYKDDGSVWDTWCQGQSQVLLWPDQKQWIVVRPLADPTLPNPNYVDYSKTDLPEFSWIDQSNFIGVETFKGVECLKFKGTFKLLADDVPIEVTAFIDKETRYPQALIKPDGTFIYTFDSRIPSDQIPSIVKKLLIQVTLQSRIVRTAPIPE